MSQQLIDRNPDLKRLRDEGYDVVARDGVVMLRDVPYVNSSRIVKRGILVSALDLAAHRTVRPGTHVAYFAGEHPCNVDGTIIQAIRHSAANQTMGGVNVNFMFSNKPPKGYTDFYEKMVTYATIIASPAEAIDSGATARTNPAVRSSETESVFNYWDTASSRAGISALSEKLAMERISIVGLGGTGSYILDLISKAPVKEIHIFDGDVFLNHNAFRTPGAASYDKLEQRKSKVTYLKEVYSEMHRHIIAHECFVNESNVDLLRNMSFIFLCLDRGEDKHLLVERLENWNVPFVDVGMGVQETNNMLGGILRVTTSANGKNEIARGMKRIPFADGDGDNDYSKNIQIADLNCLNAALAVIKWKKFCGFYRDLEQEYHTTYTIDGNQIINEDQA